MSLPITPEMEKLWEKFEPYLMHNVVGVKFKKDTPQEILEAHKEYVRLGKEQNDAEIETYFE